ncbi:MAG: transglutaminase domain-containing protein [Candidatus Aminicenantes bacterium]|nr:transglutaminase domain-containing protein [Candidatus Aminicenantes bacterium]
MDKRRPSVTALAAASWILLCLVLPCGPDAPAAEEAWYVISIAGRRAGRMHHSTERAARDGLPLYRTRSESLFLLSRLGAGLEIGSSTVTLETEEGDLLEVFSELKLSDSPMITEARVEEGKVILKSYTGRDPSAASEREVPFTGRLLGPEGIRRAAEAGLKNPGDTVIVQSFLTELSKPVTVTQVLEAVAPLPESFPPREALRVAETNSALPQKRTVWLDRSGRTLLSSDASPLGELTARLTTREDALSLSSPAEAAALPLEESLARSNVRLPQARAIEAVTLRLERKDPALGRGWDGLEGPGQRVLEKAAGHLILRVEQSPCAAVPAVSPSDSGSPIRPGRIADSEDVDEFLRSNQYIDTDDEVLRRAVAEALGGEGGGEDSGLLGRALRLENWVSVRMKVDAGIAFAPSSEVVRNGRGTCTEYAVLLAAMLRAAGIPSRILMGCVYLNGAWGGHAWVEARFGGSWFGLDAAVNGPCLADAARFVLARSSLNDGLGELLSSGQGLFGNLRVSVLNYALKGEQVVVDPDSPLYSLEGDIYFNPGLGLRVRKPDGFAFEDLDKTWPDDTLLTMRNPEGMSVRVLQDAWRPGAAPEESAYRRLEELVPRGRRSRLEVSGRSWPLVESERTKDGDPDGEESAAAAVLDGVDVWLFVSKGSGAASRLREILDSFSWGRSSRRL